MLYQLSYTPPKNESGPISLFPRNLIYRISCFCKSHVHFQLQQELPHLYLHLKRQQDPFTNLLGILMMSFISQAPDLLKTAPSSTAPICIATIMQLTKQDMWPA